LAAEAGNLLHECVVFRPILDYELDFDVHGILPGRVLESILAQPAVMKMKKLIG